MKKSKVITVAGILLLFHVYSTKLKAQCNLLYSSVLDTALFVPNGGTACVYTVPAGMLLKIENWSVSDPCSGVLYTVDFDRLACSTTGTRGKYDVLTSSSSNANETPAPMWLSAGTYINVENPRGCGTGGIFNLMGIVYQVVTP